MSDKRERAVWRFILVCTCVALGSLLLSACSSPINILQTPAATTPTAAKPSANPAANFPSAPLQLRTPAFANGEQAAPTVKVLASADPTLIVQFPLIPSGIKAKFPDASGLVTVFQNPQANDFDSMTVNVDKMPPNVKFTVFLTELSTKPFGHAEYAGDVITRADGKGESTFHLIAFVAFAADARNNVTSADQSGTASGIQLEHLGLWFDGVQNARDVLGNQSITGTPFDGGGGPLHAGPQALTDGQTLPVI